MTRLDLSSYDGSAGPPPGSVPVTVIVLARDEEPNIERCLHSAEWAAQRIVVDSGSRDATPELARRCGALVMETEWRGFAAQREWALRLPVTRHDWVFFLDADEWISIDLADEIRDRVVTADAGASAYRLRYRLVFAGRWIRRCGWYRGSWIVRLMRRSRCRYVASERFAERVVVDGPVGTLRNDLVDEDRKGVAAWLHKHVRYAELEAERRLNRPGLSARLALVGHRRRAGTLLRHLLKEVVYPAVPGKPLALFVYMYLVRMGFLDGRSGLRFCLLHAWHEHNVGMLLAGLRRERSATRLSSPTLASEMPSRETAS